MKEICNRTLTVCLPEVGLTARQGFDEVSPEAISLSFPQPSMLTQASNCCLPYFNGTVSILITTGLLRKLHSLRIMQFMQTSPMILSCQNVHPVFCKASCYNSHLSLFGLFTLIPLFSCLHYWKWGFTDIIFMGWSRFPFFVILINFGKIVLGTTNSVLDVSLPLSLWALYFNPSLLMPKLTEMWVQWYSFYGIK